MSRGYELFEAGNNYRKGSEGCEQNGEKALELLLQAKAEGYACENEIGLVYLYGTQPVPKNYLKAKEYFEMDPDDEYCLFNLGVIFSNGGYGVEQDMAKAIDYYTKSADLGHGTSCVRLGEIYWRGKGVEADYQLAQEWLERSVSRENVSGQYMLGKFLAYGPDKSLYDCKRAVLLFSQIPEESSYYKNAQILLGKILIEGRDNVPMDEDRAFTAFSNSLKFGNQHAARYLGDCYRDAKGTQVDFDKAREYYQLGLEKGIAHCDELLESLGEKEKEARIVYCPYCGRPMIQYDHMLDCPNCNEHLPAEPFRDLGYIRHYNLANQFRQGGMHYDAMYHSRILLEDFVPTAQAYWCSFLARYGIRFIEGRYLFHIERMNMDTVMFDPDLLKALELAEEPYRSVYLQLSEDIAKKMRRYQARVDTYRRVDNFHSRRQPKYILLYNPEDQKAVEYASRLKESQKDIVFRDLQEAKQERRVNFPEEVISYCETKYASAMIVVASARKYLYPMEHEYLRFSEFAKYSPVKVLYRIAVGDPLEIYEDPDGSEIYSDRESIPDIATRIKRRVLEWENSFERVDADRSCYSWQLFEQIEQARKAKGMEALPEEIPGIVKDIKVLAGDQESSYITFDGHSNIRIRAELERDMTATDTYHFLFEIYKGNGERVWYFDQDFTIKPGENLFFVTFEQYYNSGELALTPGLYYAAATVNTGRRIACFAVGEDETTADFRALADRMDIPVPREHWGSTYKERREIRLQLAIAEYLRRTEEIKPKFRLAVRSEERGIFVNRHYDYTIWLRLADGTCYVGKTGEGGVIKPFQKTEWDSTAEKYEILFGDDRPDVLKQAFQRVEEERKILPICFLKVISNDNITLWLNERGEFGGKENLRYYETKPSYPNLKLSSGWYYRGLFRITSQWRDAGSIYYTSNEFFGITWDGRIEPVLHDGLHTWLDELAEGIRVL